MSIKYRMESNNLKPGSFFARVIHGDAITLDQMIPNIVAKTSLSPADVKGVIMALTDEVAAALGAGNRPCIDGLVSFSTSLSGSFDTADAAVSKETAQLNVLAREDPACEAAVKAQASYSRQVVDIKTPIISSFLDIAGGAYDQYTPGSIVRLKGDNLKFNLNEADEGVFVDNGTAETRLNVYSITGDRQIDALIPADMSGTLTVTVRARYTEEGDLRQGSYQHQVVPA